MRIALIVYSLRPGGAERVASTLVNYWAKSDDRVTLISLESQDTDFYELAPSVRRVALGAGYHANNWWESIVNTWRRVKLLHTVFSSSNFDVVVSFGDKTNLLTLLATLRSPLPVVVSEHADPRKHSIGAIAACLRRLLYPRARMVVVLTAGIGTWANRIVRHDAIRVIPNPVADQFLQVSSSNVEKKHQSVVAMGRMVSEKGFDLLLRAFALSVVQHPQWVLRIFGQGTESRHLRFLAHELGIETKVNFNPVTHEVAKIFRESELFVLSSRYEAFPMVLLEAMACGLPVISFDCMSGPREIIRDGLDGILVPPDDVSALANAMNGLMGSPEERRRLGSRAIEVSERFSISHVGALWREVFDEVII